MKMFIRLIKYDKTSQYKKDLILRRYVQNINSWVKRDGYLNGIVEKNNRPLSKTRFK